MSHRTAFLVVTAVALLLGSCQTSDPIPTTSSIALSVVDTDLATQAAATPGFQISRWTIQSASIDIQDWGRHDFLTGPCTFTRNVLTGGSLGAECAASGLITGTDASRKGTLHLVVASWDLTWGDRPDLPAGGDYDADGVTNSEDNCVLIANPGQEDVNDDGFGDACSVLDTTTNEPIYPDRDGDGKVDGVDDCLWVPNPVSDEASVVDGIGDTCRRTVPVTLPNGVLTIDKDLDLPNTTGRITLVSVDFNDETSVTCSGSKTSCRLDPAAITVTVTQN